MTTLCHRYSRIYISAQGSFIQIVRLYLSNKTIDRIRLRKLDHWMIIDYFELPYTHRMRRVLIYICLIMLSLVIVAQSPSFRHLTNTDGLSENWVRQVIKDSRGYIWIATSQGLDRYDGYNLINFRANVEDSTALRSNDIYRLYLNSHGNLMVGSGEGGVAEFDYSLQRFKNFDMN